MHTYIIKLIYTCSELLHVSANCVAMPYLIWNHLVLGQCPLLVLTNTGCPRRNVTSFGRVFLMLNYTDITQNIYIQS